MLLVTTTKSFATKFHSSVSNHFHTSEACHCLTFHSTVNAVCIILGVNAKCFSFALTSVVQLKALHYEFQTSNSFDLQSSVGIESLSEITRPIRSLRHR